MELFKSNIILSCYSFSGIVLIPMSWFYLSHQLRARDYAPHYTDEETEASQGKVTFPRPHPSFWLPGCLVPGSFSPGLQVSAAHSPCAERNGTKSCAAAVVEGREKEGDSVFHIGMTAL